MRKFPVTSLVSVLFVLLMLTSVFAQRDVLIKHGINPNPQTESLIPQITYSPAGRARAAATTGGTAATAVLNYHNGALINTPSIYLIWYGNWNQSNGSDTPAAQQLIRDWAAGVGGSPHFQLNTSLSVSGKPISGNVTYGGQTTDTGTRTSLSDAQIKTVVSSAISSNRLPYNLNGIYFVITSSNVTASSGFCTQYCGYHTNSSIANGNIRYSYVGNANRCLSACAVQSSVSPNNNPGIDGSISVLTHELEEATTDPDASPAGWFANSNGSENGDLCAYTFGHSQFQTANGSFANMTFGGHNWLIQRNIMKVGSSFFCMVDSTHN